MSTPERRTRPPRIFIGPFEVAGHMGALADGFRAIGVPADFHELRRNPFQYRTAAGRPSIANLIAGLGIRRRRAGRPAAMILGALEVLCRLALIAWALTRYDVFIYGYGESILRGIEYPLLKRFGRTVIFVFLGSDSRPPYMDGPDLLSRDGASPEALARLVLRKKRLVTRLERYADFIVCNPLTAQFAERPFVSFFALGLAMNLHATAMPIPTPPSGKSVRILHSPSDPAVKGTQRIRDAVDLVRAEGHLIEFVELRGVPHQAVLAELQRCDFVVDQAYSDVPMAGFAAEAAWAGRPAVVAGYGWDELRRLIPADEMPPVEACEPDAMAASIRRLVVDPDLRRDLGSRARAYVTADRPGEVVARRYLTLIRGAAPRSWFVDPREVRYAAGCGAPRERVAAAVDAIVAAGSPRDLCVSDKPDLERAVLALAIERRAAERPPAMPAGGR